MFFGLKLELEALIICFWGQALNWFVQESARMHIAGFVEFKMQVK